MAESVRGPGATHPTGSPSTGLAATRSATSSLPVATSGRAAGLIGVLVLLVTLLVPASAAHAVAHRDAEVEFIRLVNVERSNRGLATLTERFDIRDVAYAWSTSMSRTDVLAHNPQFSSQICCWQRVSENVGVSRGRTDWSEAVASLHRALMESPGHRSNVLQADVREIGVGVWYDGYAMWVTQNFRQSDGTTPPPGTPPPATSEPARELATPVVRGTALACPSRLLSLVSYIDVPLGSLAAPSISCVSAWEIAQGVGGGRYAPAGSVTRGQMATFISRTISATGGELSSGGSPSFDDVRGHLHEAAIRELASAGLVSGCGPSSFCPDALVTRAQMASFLAAAWGAIDGSDLPAGPEHFLDDDKSPHQANIDAVAGAGLAAGVADGRYGPGQPVTRSQMALFLARLLDLSVDEGHATPPSN